MTRKRTSAGKEQVRKLKLRKMTIKDLDSKGDARRIKGGAILGGSACGKTCKKDY